MNHKHALWLRVAIALAVLLGGLAGRFRGESMLWVKWIEDRFPIALTIVIAPRLVIPAKAGIQ